MEIPKMKVFIYLLTFAAYSWSGYGSNVLGNLRDAVLSAEVIFGDVLEKVTDVFRTIHTVKETLASNDILLDDCSWSCPDGVKPKPNKYYKARANGCGPEGMEVDTNVLPPVEMTKCCNEHDICYGTCGKEKQKCDKEFQRCLHKICDSGKLLSDQIITGCKTAAELFYTATSTLGCKYYQDAQYESCYCPISKKKYHEL